MWNDFEEAVGIDDSLFCVVGIGVFHDDDGAAIFDLVEVKGIFVLLGKFDVLVKETDIVLCEVLVLVIIFLLDQLLLELVRPDPGEELHSEFPTLEDQVVEMQLHLLNCLLRVRLKIAKFRVLHNYNYIALPHPLH